MVIYKVHAHGLAVLEAEQDAPKPGDQMRGEPRAIIPFVERPQPLVPDLHGPTVGCGVTRRQLSAGRHRATGINLARGASSHAKRLICAGLKLPRW